MATIAGLFLAFIILGAIGLLVTTVVAFITGFLNGGDEQYKSLYPGGNYSNGWIFPLSLVYDFGYSAYKTSKDRQAINKKRFNRE